MLKSLLYRVLALLALLAIAYLGFVNWELKRAAGKEAAAKTALLAEVARANGAKQATVTKTIVVTQTKLVPFVKAAVSAGGTPQEHLTADATISDVERTQPVSNAATTWDDPHHRFHLDLSTGTFTRKQLFKFEAVVVNAPDKKTRFIKGDLVEFDPVTKEQLDGSGITVDTSVEEIKQGSPVVSPLGVRIVAAVDERLALGAGVNFLDWHHVEASVLGFYDRKTGKFDAGLGVGYRIAFPHLDTNFSIGPFYSPFSKRLGAAITLQVTR